MWPVAGDTLWQCWRTEITAKQAERKEEEKGYARGIQKTVQ